MSLDKKLTMLVDDDSTCNSLSKILLKRVFSADEKNEVKIISFDKPVEGLKFLTEALIDYKFQKILILLDINMPLMTGWEFIAEYAGLPKTQTDVTIYILTSSVSKADMDSAKENLYVEDFISKPLTPEIIETLYEKMK